ncbi:carboxypeptidase regulatory-like domain-containing protein [Silvibacterium sp.]|uniref:carboxypeptidase regulatory-like domain-containing protein n=1 Tax=Silvibacterium sp. TaxID=1964179 RepID=UPI0039E5374E
MLSIAVCCRLRLCRSLSFLLLVTLLLHVPFLLAQSTTGRILGRVLDPSGAVVPGATLTITNADSGLTQTVQSSKSGEYLFLSVPIGRYKLTAAGNGFRDFVVESINVQLNSTVSYDVKLVVGSSTESIEVSAAPPLVDTTSTQLGAVVNSRAIENLPLNQRNTYQLLQLQPGVTGVSGSDLFYGSDQAGAVSVNGGRGRSNNFSVNGGDGNDLFVNSPGIEPSPDAIDEFRVITNTFDAEYGRNSGAVINVVTKSGGNSMHGSIYGYVRNQSMDSKGYFDLATPEDSQEQFGATVGGPVRKDKTFYFLSYEGRQLRKGISSDRVRVPTAQERAGVFGGDPFSGALTDGTAASIIANRAGCAAAISSQGGTVPDPVSVAQGNAMAWSSIFPGNVIPQACFDPVAANILSNYVPLPNVAGDEYESAPLQHARENQGTFRFDHKFSDSNSFTAYYYADDDFEENPFTKFQAEIPNLLPGFGSDNATRNQQINLSDTWTLNASTQNEVRATYYREGQRTFLHPQRTNLVTESCTGAASAYCFNGNSDTPLYAYASDGTATGIANTSKLGITPGLTAGHEGVPYISISGGFTIGNDSEGELPQVGNTYSLMDNFSKTIGNHSLKFGVDARNQRFDQTLYYDINGYFSYSGGSENDLGAENLFGNYLLGFPDSYSQGSPQTENIRAYAVYLFAEDSYKIRSNLTLNYGLRWELNQPLADVSHRVQTFRAGQADTQFPCVLSASSEAALGATDTDCGPGSDNEAVFPLGLVVPGDKGVPAGLTATYYKAFAPRIGMAWSPESFHGKLVVRSGFGIFYNPMEQLVMEQFQGEPPFGGSNSISAPLFQTPFVTQYGTVSPNAFNGFLEPKPGDSVDWSAFRPIIMFGELQPNLRTQYTEQYNLQIQHEIASNLVMTIGYVGSQGHRLLATYDLNHGNPQTCLDLAATSAYNGDSSYNCSPYGEDSAYYIPAGETIAPQGLHLPYGATPFLQGGTAVPSGGITLVGLRQYSSPYCDPMSGTGCPADGVPVFSSIFAQDVVANSAYNSLQASLEKRFSQGVQFLASYTFAKSTDDASSFEQSLDPLDPKRDRAESLYDARHRFVFSGVWDLPFPKHGGAQGVFENGWQISGITTLQSGFPIRLDSNLDQELQGSGDFENPGRPDIVKTFTHRNPRTPLNGDTGYYFDPAIFATPALGSAGNAPRSICCGPPVDGTDFAVQKLTPVHRGTLEFTFQVFNIFNHTQFLNPDGQLGDAQFNGNNEPVAGGLFGEVTRVRDPRQMQLALRFKM